MSLTCEPLSESNVKPKPKTYIEYSLDDGRSVKATVLSKQPKRKGQHGNWVNIHVDGDDDPSSVNWDDVSNWKELKPSDQLVLLSSDDEMSQQVIDAKEREINNLMENDVFEEVLHNNQQLISSKWVITTKVKDDATVVKARLVARGFEENTSDARTDSPTCSRQSLRMAFITAPTMGWEIHSLDITSAFLQGNSIERKVYLKPSSEAGTDGRVWRLKRSIYGLNDAPRAWYDRVRKELLDLDGKTSSFDEAMFLWHDDECRLIGLVVTHVDDFVYCGTKDWHENVMGRIMKTLA
jgi:hypothetical protein